jgi:hypothetical protein
MSMPMGPGHVPADSGYAPYEQRQQQQQFSAQQHAAAMQQQFAARQQQQQLPQFAPRQQQQQQALYGAPAAYVAAAPPPGFQQYGQPGDSLAHIHNGNVHQHFAGVNDAAAQFISSGTVPTAGLSGASMPGGFRPPFVGGYGAAGPGGFEFSVDCPLFVNQPRMGMHGSVRGNLLLLEQLIAGAGRVLVCQPGEFIAAGREGRREHTLLTEAAVLNAFPESDTFRAVHSTWLAARLNSGYIYQQEVPQFFSFCKQLNDAWDTLRVVVSAPELPKAWSTFLLLHRCLLQLQHQSGKPWHALPVQAVTTRHVVQLSAQLHFDSSAAPRPQRQRQQPQQQQQQQQPRLPRRSIQLTCHKFNSKAGCQTPGCTYPHICDRCGADGHTAITCTVLPG